MTFLKEEKPFACVGHTNQLPYMCSFCFSRRKFVSQCKGCHVLSYCDTNCQQKDWVNHKKECGLLKMADEAPDKAVPDDIVRLVARILLKSEKALAQKAFNDRSWEDLNDDLPKMTDETAPIFERQIDSIVDFLKPRKIVSREVAKSALCKVYKYNFDIFNIDENAENILGIGIYLGFSVHKHNCIPNAQLMFSGAKALLRPFDEEADYSTDLTISYTLYSPHFLYRERNWLECLAGQKKKNSWREKFFNCTCPICADENHLVNRMGSSCRVTCCENAAGILDENSSSPYVCNKCDTPSEITVKEVKRAETKIVEFLKQMENIETKFDIVEAKKLIHTSEQVLSLYNFRYLNLCDEIVGLSKGGGPFLKTDGQMVLKHIADEMLKGYRYYLPDTHLLLTRSLMIRSSVKIALDYLDDFDVNTAIEAAERTYGKRHRVTVSCKRVYDYIKKINAKKRDELFREAGKLNW